MSQPTSPVRYTLQFRVSRAEQKLNRARLVEVYQRHRGTQLGIEIATKKTWHVQEDADGELHTLDILVLTYEELHQLLQEAIRTYHNEHAVAAQSERHEFIG